MDDELSSRINRPDPNLTVRKENLAVRVHYYRSRWMSLGGELSIHGSPLVPTNQTLGCISLSPQDARDVYGILTVRSEVTIRR